MTLRPEDRSDSQGGLPDERSIKLKSYLGTKRPKATVFRTLMPTFHNAATSLFTPSSTACRGREEAVH
jgi:hypothetical protein